MQSTGIRNLDNAIQTTNIWLRDLDLILGWDDRVKTYAALRTVLHALRDELIVEEAVDLAAQIPLFIRGLYYEGWVPAKTPSRERDLESFLTRVSDNYSQSDAGRIDPRWLCQSVFALLNKHVSPGEIDDVKGMLFSDLQNLWPDDDFIEGDTDAGKRPTTLH